MLPRIIVQPKLEPEKCIFKLHDEDIELHFEKNEKDNVFHLLSAIDGTKPVAKLVDEFSRGISFDIENFINEMYKHRVMEDCSFPEGRSGINVLFELEDLANELLYKKLYNNVFWRACQAAKTKNDIPLNVMYGLVIENYHFLHRESYFDAPVLSYVSNTNVRLAMNEFFAEEYGHDELLLKSLNSIDITREELNMTMPLPQTMAMCNVLAYWAHNDPIFFFTTLGILEGKDIKQDSFIDTAIRIGLGKDFIAPVQAHSNINLKGGHGSLTREIFSEIPIIDLSTIKRLRSQTHLFIELYDNFYTGIWSHYSSSTKLLHLLNDV